MPYYTHMDLEDYDWDWDKYMDCVIDASWEDE